MLLIIALAVGCIIGWYAHKKCMVIGLNSKLVSGDMKISPAFLEELRNSRRKA